MARKFLIVLAAVSALGTTAHAGVDYFNGLPNGVSGNEATAWTQTEDFSLSNTAALSGATVFVGEDGGWANWDGHLQYSLWSDNGGDPGAILATGDLTPLAVDYGLPFDGGGDIYEIGFRFLTPFNAVGGTEYHLGIHLSAMGDNNRDGIYFVTTDPNGTATGRESYQSTYDNWFDNGQEHAFFLFSDVPEPAAWGLMLAGFGMAGGALRRRRALA